MGIAADFPLTARGRRGKGPRTKAKARVARARRDAEALDAQPPRPPRSDRWRPADDIGTLDARMIGRSTVHRPGQLHDPRSGRPIVNRIKSVPTGGRL